MTHDDSCPIGKTMSEAIAIQGRHVDPYHWVCVCDRLAAAYRRGHDDRSAEWQDVLSSANRRAWDEALAAAFDAVQAVPTWDYGNAVKERALTANADIPAADGVRRHGSGNPDAPPTADYPGERDDAA